MCMHTAFFKRADNARFTHACRRRDLFFCIAHVKGLLFVTIYYLKLVKSLQMHVAGMQKKKLCECSLMESKCKGVNFSFV